MGVVDELAKDLAERGADYGPFYENSVVFKNIRDDIMDALLSNKRFQHLHPREKATLEHGVAMISTKLARIATGDPKHHDSWKDIAGYAHIIDRDLHHLPRQTDTTPSMSFAEGGMVSTKETKIV